MTAWSSTLVMLMMVGLIENFDWCKHDCVPMFPGMPVQKHTMCSTQYPQGGGPTCSRYTMGLSKEEQDMILDLHNQFRATVANGQETRGSGGSQPGAANMMEMVWDDEVAMIAQRWADQCRIRGHDACRKTMDNVDVGQNIGGMSGSGMIMQRSTLITGRVTAWYDEVKDMVPSDVDSVFRSSTKTTGHYTQVVWATTTRVGCGVAHLDDRSFAIKIVCNYKPAGNFISQKVYIQGPATSKCPKNSVPSTKYQGLCKAIGNDLDIGEPSLPPSSNVPFPMIGQMPQLGKPNLGVTGSGIELPPTTVNVPPGTPPRPIVFPFLVPPPTTTTAVPVQPTVVTAQGPEKKKKKDSLFWRIITFPWRVLKWIFCLPFRIFEFIRSKLFD